MVRIRGHARGVRHFPGCFGLTPPAQSSAGLHSRREFGLLPRARRAGNSCVPPPHSAASLKSRPWPSFSLMRSSNFSLSAYPRKHKLCRSRYENGSIECRLASWISCHKSSPCSPWSKKPIKENEGQHPCLKATRFSLLTVLSHRDRMYTYTSLTIHPRPSSSVLD